ncbi:MAG: translation initiation factor IF-3 [Actinobacteria bacterium]|nr:translation initiation factor IF-3 [Actinomycetota bacterium]
MGFIQFSLRVNERIRASEVLVIDPDGNKLGVMSINKALDLAQNEYGLDLVEVAPNAKPPVCRIMDYGRWRYEQEQKLKKAKKHQQSVVIKELKIRPKIGEHDLQVKLKHAKEFLSKGQKVKFTLRFRGREIVHQDLAAKLLERIASELSELSSVEAKPRLEGRFMVMMLAPRKDASKKQTEKAEKEEQITEDNN